MVEQHARGVSRDPDRSRSRSVQEAMKTATSRWWRALAASGLVLTLAACERSDPPPHATAHQPHLAAPQQATRAPWPFLNAASSSGTPREFDPHAAMKR